MSITARARLPSRHRALTNPGGFSRRIIPNVPRERVPVKDAAMKAEIEAAVGRVAEVVMFENWLRFYFISEEDGRLLIRLPEKAMEQLKQRYKNFYDLAEMLNNEEIDHQHSLKAVCMFVSGGFDGRPLPDAVVSGVFDSPQFQLELQLFSNWVQNHEEKLDERFMEFSEWRKAFALWKETDEVKTYTKRLNESMTLAVTDASKTMQ